MKNYVNVKKTGSNIFSVNFDLNSFVSFQQQIALKYQTKEELLYENIESKGFINNYDRYLLHCIEEISEVRDAILTHKDINEIREELVDVLMYLGTMTSLVQLNMERYEMKTRENFELQYLTYVDHFNSTMLFDKSQKPLITSDVPVTIDLKLMEVIHLLIEERRMFPQRKWHKPSVNDSELQFKYKMNKLYANNIKCMEIVLQLLMEDRSCSERYINEMINSKGGFVINLPMPE